MRVLSWPSEGRGTSSGIVPTHVRGLDDLLGGGIPACNVVLFTGTPGARKTSLVYHILHHNAREGRRGLFLADGVFLRHYDVGETGVQLRLRCVKMRRARHEEGYYALDRDPNGFYVTNVISRQGEHLLRR